MNTKTHLTMEDIEDLLNYIGVNKIKQWKGYKIQFCCPIHGESNPSCGINLDYRPYNDNEKSLQTFHCFSCGASGSIPKFLYLSMPDDFKNIYEAISFIKNRYQVDYYFSTKLNDFVVSVNKYEDMYSQKTENRKVLKKSELALFKSGKETYKYFFNRGFSKEDMKEYLIGRDLKNRTVTIPIFYEDNKLAGFIGRYIDKDRPKNMRYKVYNFQKSKTLYLSEKLEKKYNTIICVESSFDAILLRKWGFRNVVSTLGDGLSIEQADIIKRNCEKFIALFDNDKGGNFAYNISLKRLSDFVEVVKPTYYPANGKDPSEWGEIETIKVINSAKYNKFDLQVARL